MTQSHHQPADRTLVKDLFDQEKIEEDWLYENLDGQSPYEDRCFDFVVQNWEKEIEFMSPKQVKWLNDIVESCVEKRIRLQRLSHGRP